MLEHSFFGQFIAVLNASSDVHLMKTRFSVTLQVKRKTAPKESAGKVPKLAKAGTGRPEQSREHPEDQSRQKQTPEVKQEDEEDETSTITADIVVRSLIDIQCDARSVQNRESWFRERNRCYLSPFETNNSFNKERIILKNDYFH